MPNPATNMLPPCYCSLLPAACGTCSDYRKEIFSMSITTPLPPLPTLPVDAPHICTTTVGALPKFDFTVMLQEALERTQVEFEQVQTENTRLRNELNDAMSKLAQRDEHFGWLRSATNTLTNGEALAVAFHWKQQAAALLATPVYYNEWYRWEERAPRKDEAGWVIFKDKLNGRVWIQSGTVVEGEFWNYQPIAWQLKPVLPFWAEA
jgi:hypothetical protein